MIYAAATIATGKVISTAPVAAATPTAPAIRLDATGAFHLYGAGGLRMVLVSMSLPHCAQGDTLY